jgi:hypothetical protein
MSKYLCWNCGLWQGDEQDDLESSKLCPSCRSAIEATNAKNAAFIRSRQEETEDA